MAVSSFPRPDPSSPASVASADFGTARKGFDQHEVRQFLRLVAAEIARLHDRERGLEQALLEAKDAKAGGGPSNELIDDDTATRLLGEEAAHILQAARESAASVRSKAEESAATILRQATDDAARIREEAELDAARRRSDATADAEAQIRMVKDQGREMVNAARSYRERVLGELTRRRDLAREQIDQLLAGREQLLSAFTSARDAAVDVMSRLGPIGDVAAPFDLPPPPAITDDEGAELVGGGADDQLGQGADTGDSGDTGESGDSGDTGRLPPEHPGAVFFDQDDDDDLAGPPQPSFAEDRAGSGGESAADDDAAARSLAERTGRVVELFPHAEALDDDEQPGAGPAQSATVESLFAKLRAASVDDVESHPTATGPATDDTSVGDTTELPVTDAADQFDLADDETRFQRRDAELTPLIVAAARRVKRVLAEEQNEVLDALRQGQPVNAIDELLVSEPEQSGRYVDAIMNELESAVSAGAASVSGDPSIEVTRTGALGPVREAIAANLVQPLRQRLERCVADAEGDNDAAAKRVRSVYREWKSRQVDNQLDDVFRMAHGRGVLAALPEGTPVRWTVDPDGPACPDAEDNSLCEPIPAGDGFPTGHVCAPAHAGCRCLLEPAER